MIAASLAFAGVLVIPSAWYAWKHLAHPEVEPAPWKEPHGFVAILTIVVVIVTGIALWLGSWASSNPNVSWFLLPVLNIIASGLPALWIIYIGTRGLIPGKPSRKWGVFTTGFILSPIVILVLELFALVGIGILAIIWIMLNPSLAEQLQSLAFRLQSTNGNPEALLRILTPFLLDPVILIMVFAFISVIVPMIEEALKPIGVWLLVGQRITPAQGFGYGVLGGVGFGLFENLGNTSTNSETWALLVGARISTLLLHGLSAGMVGWGLISAWRYKRYLRLVGAYIFAILIHGLWNGMAVLTFIASLEGQTNIPVPSNLAQLGNLSAIVIFAWEHLTWCFLLGSCHSATQHKENLPSTKNSSGWFLPSGLQRESSPQYRLRITLD
jgi:hypothetical protein